MARAKRGAQAAAIRVIAEAEAAPILLLYVRAPGKAPRQLDASLAQIIARYAPLVELRTLLPRQVPERFASFAARTPIVLVLRRGELVGEAMGDLLPVRELDSVVRCAVEWPDAPPVS